MNNYTSMSSRGVPYIYSSHYVNSGPAAPTFEFAPASNTSDASVQQSRFKMPAFITNMMEAISNFFRALFNLSSPKSQDHYHNMKIGEPRLLGRLEVNNNHQAMRTTLEQLGFNESTRFVLNQSVSFVFDTDDGYKFTVYVQAGTGELYLKRLA